jgi:hypothetical protein
LATKIFAFDFIGFKTMADVPEVSDRIGHGTIGVNGDEPHWHTLSSMTPLAVAPLAPSNGYVMVRIAIYSQWCQWRPMVPLSPLVPMVSLSPLALLVPMVIHWRQWCCSMNGDNGTIGANGDSRDYDDPLAIQ